jgi:hypothetical protein
LAGSEEEGEGSGITVSSGEIMPMEGAIYVCSIGSSLDREVSTSPEEEGG